MFTIEFLKKLRTSQIMNGFAGIDGFTPLDLVVEQFDKIPVEWSNPNLKFLIPAAGHGTYGIVGYWRLMEGLKQVFINEDERSRHILKNMLYLNEINSWLCQQLSRQGFVNIIKKDFLKLDIDMKFDVVIGNPPYQENHEDGRSKKNALRLWAKFVISVFDKNLLKRNGYLSFVTPSGWAGSSSQVFNTLQKYKLVSADFSSSVSQSFNNVGGTMVFTTFVVQNSKNTNNCANIKFDQGVASIDLFSLPITPIKSSNMYDFTIISKMLNSNISGLNWKRFDDKNKEVDGLSIVMSRSKSENNNADFSHNLEDRSGFWLYGDEELLGNVLNNINLPIYKHFRWVVRSGMAIANNIKTLPIPTNISLTTDGFCDLFNLNDNEREYVRSIS
jgi:hypothetical protein